jgi:hypothetical protein
MKNAKMLGMIDCCWRTWQCYQGWDAVCGS